MERPDWWLNTRKFMPVDLCVANWMIFAQPMEQTVSQRFLNLRSSKNRLGALSACGLSTRAQKLDVGALSLGLAADHGAPFLEARTCPNRTQMGIDPALVVRLNRARRRMRSAMRTKQIRHAVDKLQQRPHPAEARFGERLVH